MREDIWIERAETLEPFDGQGISISVVAEKTGLNVFTVKRYAEKFGFDFSRKPFDQTLVHQLTELADQGKTRKEAASDLGISYATVVKYPVDFDHGGKRHTPNERENAMAAMYRSGKTLAQIGALHGVSRERVRQLLTKFFGITRPDGGQSAAVERRRQRDKARKDARCLEKHGCLFDEYQEFLRLGKEMRSQGMGLHKTPIGAFRSQRNNAIHRGIEWNLKFWDWWQVWHQSGKWEERGRAKDAYVMCRFKDDGAYEASNVYIATLYHNSSFQPNNPYRVGHPDHDKVMVKHRKALSDAQLNRRGDSRKRKYKDLPVGVTRKKGRLISQIAVYGKNKYLGSFETVEQARSAYLEALAEIEARKEA